MRIDPSSITTGRRHFILTAAAVGAATQLPWWVRRAAAQGASSKLRVACVGCGGMGASDLAQVASHPGVSIAALCDVNRDTLAKQGETYAVATEHRFTDYREFLAKAADRIDAVIVSTPDHAHAPVAVQAMRMGKHAYVQKPLTHSLHEARVIAQTAAAKKVVTQMGIQNTANPGRRKSMELLKAGVLGQVKAVHIWTNRPSGWWPQGGDRPAGSDPVPANLDWASWLCVAPERPYKNDAYAPFKWRGVRDFGTGALGDMACHFFDVPYKALGLGYPTLIRGESEGLTAEQYPSSEVVELTFEGVAAAGGKSLTLTWYDGGRMPSTSILPGVPADFNMAKRSRDGATIVVGERGTMIVCHPGDVHLFPGTLADGAKLPELPEYNHWHQWVDACMGKGTTSAPLEFAGPLTEGVLCGVIGGVVHGKTLRYDSAKQTFDDATATAMVRRAYRDGWKVEGLG
jgi:predicted dehydrogenase